MLVQSLFDCCLTTIEETNIWEVLPTMGQSVIEEVRSQLEQMAMSKGFDFLDPSILEMSQLLDKLIVEHMVDSRKRL